MAVVVVLVVVEWITLLLEVKVVVVRTDDARTYGEGIKQYRYTEVRHGIAEEAVETTGLARKWPGRHGLWRCRVLAVRRRAGTGNM